MSKDTPEPFALYVTGVQGRVVPRYGTRGKYLGVTRIEPTIVNGRGVGGGDWNWHGRVEAVSHAEYNTYRTEYERALRDGDLLRSSKEAFERSEKERADARTAEIEGAKEKQRLEAETARKAEQERQDAAAKIAEEKAKADAKAAADAAALERKKKTSGSPAAGEG